MICSEYETCCAAVCSLIIFVYIYIIYCNQQSMQMYVHYSNSVCRFHLVLFSYAREALSRQTEYRCSKSALFFGTLRSYNPSMSRKLEALLAM